MPSFSLRAGAVWSKPFFGHVSHVFLTFFAKAHLLQSFRKTDNQIPGLKKGISLKAEFR